MFAMALGFAWIKALAARVHGSGETKAASPPSVRTEKPQPLNVPEPRRQWPGDPDACCEKYVNP